MNEPHTPTGGDHGIDLASWFADAQAAIDAIRATGATNTILVPGMNHASARLFTANGSDSKYLALTDPLVPANLAVTVHHYASVEKDAPDPGDSTVLSRTCAPLVNWARGQGVKVHVGEIAVNAEPGGGGNDICRDCSQDDFAKAQAQWNAWHNFCQANHDVILGWNWWTSSGGDWFDTAGCCGGGHWALTTDDGATQSIYMDLIQAALL